MTTTDQIKTVYDLKRMYYYFNPNGHFFDSKTMKFFGDTMKNYGLRIHANYFEVYRRKAVKHGLNTSAYFEKKTLNQVSKERVLNPEHYQN